VIHAGLTPSEVWDAWQLTGMPVKVFPASIGGPDYLRSLAGPMPQVPLMPSGGVDADNVAAFLEAGAVAVNVGGSLCSPAALEQGDLDTIASRADTLRRAIDGAG
jgi:2-dehydro-3-deoxyphosphogluconate aldolase/(4S)-4-hydroxy-2-oxoglutarate aldolase